MTRNADILAALRSLDPADPHVDATGARARADLRAILASEPASPARQVSAPGSRIRPSQRPAMTPRRVVAVTGMVAAVAAGMVVLPSLAGGDQAFASWTATPAGMSAQEQARVVADCRDSHDGGPGAAAELGALRDADPVIAERRGAWVTVVLAGVDGFSAMCITDDSAHLSAGSMIGSIGAPTDDVAPGPRALVATTLGVGTIGTGDLSMVAGAVGSDVVGVVYHSRTYGAVTATVDRGHFALWFPGDELLDAATDGVEVRATHRDGTTTTTRVTL